MRKEVIMVLLILAGSTAGMVIFGSQEYKSRDINMTSHNITNPECVNFDDGTSMCTAVAAIANETNLTEVFENITSLQDNITKIIENTSQFNSSLWDDLTTLNSVTPKNDKHINISTKLLFTNDGAISFQNISILGGHRGMAYYLNNSLTDVPTFAVFDTMDDINRKGTLFRIFGTAVAEGTDSNDFCLFEYRGIDSQKLTAQGRFRCQHPESRFRIQPARGAVGFEFNNLSAGNPTIAVDLSQVYSSRLDFKSNVTWIELHAGDYVDEVPEDIERQLYIEDKNPLDYELITVNGSLNISKMPDTVLATTTEGIALTIGEGLILAHLQITELKRELEKLREECQCIGLSS